MDILAHDPGGKRLMLGNEAIARGALEGGVEVATTYPGTPASEIGDTLASLLDDWPIYFEYAINEKVALEVAAGASLSGMRALCSMKHVGLNVASDVLASIPYSGVVGGLVVVTADDPSCHSSQNEQDNRHYARMFKVPMIEPCNPAEALSMARGAFKLSERFELPILLRSTTRVSHMRGVITLGALRRPSRNRTFPRDPRRFVLIPSVARERHVLLEERMEALKGYAEQSSFNRIIGDGSIGIIASGVSVNYAVDAIKDLGLSDEVRLLKLGFTNPLPEALIGRFLGQVERVLVVEELEPYLEGFCEQVAYRLSLPVKILGKGSGHFEVYHELGPNSVKAAVSDLTGVSCPTVTEIKPSKPIPPRPPSLCNGCPHRATFYAAKVVTGNEAIFSMDIGCYTLGIQEPLNMADFNYCMGASIGTAGGFSKGDSRPVVAFIGDSTFFHSGIPGLVNAVRNRQDVTLVIMDNGTTAMTGTQPHPGTEEPAHLAPVSIEGLVRATGIEHSEVVDPFDLRATAEALDRAVSHNGPSVIISKAPCLMALSDEEKRRRDDIVYEIDHTKCGACPIDDSAGCGVRSDPRTDLRRSRYQILGDTDPMEIAPCTGSCPAGVCVPGYISRIAAGDPQGAVDIIRRAIPLPAVCGYVCDSPCEDACQAATGDSPLAIRELKRIAALHEEPEKSGQPIIAQIRAAGKKGVPVAVIGSGPAGLGAAYELLIRGYDVTVFEREIEIGGMLRYGIPEFRLPRDVLNAELGFLRTIGIAFITDMEIGRETGLKEILEQGYEAVFIGVGAGRGLRLNIEGEDRPGVWKALDFLKECNQRRNPDLGQEIIIVGGGDTAVDSARMARRVSPASRVTILYRRDRARMRARPGEIAAALEEGVRLELLSTPRELCFNGNGGLCALEIESTTLSDLDSSSGSLPVPVEGRFRKAPCDTLIVAIGEEPDPAVQNGLGFPGDTPLTRRSKGGLFPADPRDGATCIEGVFAGGDFVTGPSTVIEAIAAGRRGGYGIDRYLSGPGVSVPTIPVASRPTSIPHTISAPSRALDSMEDCMEEALACRSCGPCAQCRNCIDNLGCGAITIRDDRVVIDPQECTKCGLCVQLCPNGAIVERHRHLAEVEARSVHVQ